MKKAPALPEPFLHRRSAQLFELGRNTGERVVQLGAEAVHDRDDGNRDARRNEAVLDGRGAGFVLHETHEEVLHLVCLLRSTRGCLSDPGDRLARGLFRTILQRNSEVLSAS